MVKYYYNDVLLPEIPSDVLAEFPYAVINLGSDGVTYALWVAENPWYFVSDLYGSKLKISQSCKNQKYLVNETGWVLSETYTDAGGIGLGSGMVWSSHNIPKGSATATDIYFVGSEPVPDGGNEPEPEYKEKYAVKSEWLVSVADEVRRLTGSEDLLTVEQMETALKSVTVGGFGHPYLITRLGERSSSSVETALL